jgi:hypothetical protein
MDLDNTGSGVIVGKPELKLTTIEARIVELVELSNT